MDTDTYFQTETNQIYLPTRVVNITTSRIRYVDGKRMIRMSRIDFDDSGKILITFFGCSDL
jgi:hypothetical protein